MRRFASFDNIRFYPPTAAVVSQSYDPVTLLKNQASGEDGSRTFYDYDSFGRLADVKDNSGAILKDFAYYYSRDGVGNGDLFKRTDPDSVRERTYRSASDFTTTKTYSDGLGEESQTEVLLTGTSDLVSATRYDSLGRPACVFKPYLASLGSRAHTFDTSYSPMRVPTIRA